MTSLKASILFYALLFILGVLSFAHEGCSHDKKIYTPEILKANEDMSSPQGGRFLGLSVYPNIRIYADFTHLEETAPPSYVAYIKNELAPSVIDWFQGALQIKYPIRGKLQIDREQTCEKPTPKALRAGVDADYVIIFDSKAENDDTVATSRACQLTDRSKRPVIATTIFNRNQFQEAKGDVLLHEKNIYLLIHEMLHTFAFSNSLYTNFLDENGNLRSGHIKTKKINGKTQTILDLPPVTERLKKFYGCSSLEGIILENEADDGTPGSHFDRNLFVYEVMASGNIYGRRVSEFTLAVLEGSGWYVPNYDYAEPFFFGQNKGCSFVTGTCSNTASPFEEFCTGSERGCAAHGRSGGKCISNPKTGECKYINPDINYDCENIMAENDARLPDLQVYGRGTGSKCFTGDLNIKVATTDRTSFCFKYNCIGTGLATKLEVSVGNNKVICDAKGKNNIEGYSGSIDCPDPQTFCNTVGKKYCPRNCMNRGACVNNKCQCKSGFTGVDCGLKL